MLVAITGPVESVAVPCPVRRADGTLSGMSSDGSPAGPAPAGAGTDAEAPGAPHRRSLVGPTAVATAFTALAMATSIANQAIAAALFGAGADYDYYRAASTLPNLFMLVFVSTIPVVCVPRLIDAEVNRSAAEASALASRVLVGMALASGGLALGLCALAPWLVGGGILAHGPAFTPPSRGFTLTTWMLRVQLANVVLAAVAGVLTSLHLARHAFTRPAAAPAIQTGVMLVAILVLHRPLGVVALAVGSVLGPLAQVIVLAPVLRGSFRPRLDLGHPDVRRVASALVPLVAASLVTKGADLVETRVASGLATGSLAVIGFASVIADRVSNLVSQGVGLTSLPDLTRHAAGGDRAAFRERFSLAMRFTLVVAIPAIVGLAVLRERLIALLLERGRFTAGDTRMVGLTLLGFAGVLVATTAGRTVTNGLYAHQRSRATALVGIAGTAIYVALAYTLPPRFEPPVAGLAVAWSITNLVNLAALAWLLRQQSGPLDGARIARSALRMVVAAGVMGAAVHWADRTVAADLLALQGTARSAAIAAELCFLGVAGFALYLALLSALGGTEGRGLAAALRGLVRPRG